MKIIQLDYWDLTLYDRIMFKDAFNYPMKSFTLIGYLVSEDKKIIRIMPMYDHLEEECMMIVIPKSCIINMKVLK